MIAWPPTSTTGLIGAALFAAWFVGVLALDLWLISISWRARRLKLAREHLAARAEELADVAVADREAGPWRTGER